MIDDIIKANEEVGINDKEIIFLKEHFPGCFKKDGSFDIENLANMLKDKVEVTREGYELNFLGKSYAKLLASVDTTTVIKPDLEHNEKEENRDSNNVYISGDNLDGLKHLLKSYSEKVKCIYIDPPYNTGTDGFVYNDNFKFTVNDLVERLSIDETQAEKTIDMATKGASSHSAWLTFMYPRLVLARNLLEDDGVIFISIDDNEQANLKVLCDDIFGEENFVTSLAWQSRTSIQNDTDISVNHEYVLLYAKKRRQENRRLKPNNINIWYKLNNFACLPLQLDKGKFSNPDNDLRGLWKADPFDAPEVRVNLTYPIKNPNTGVEYYPPEGRHWSTEENNYNKLYKDNRIVFGQTGNSKPQLKVFYEEKKKFGSVDNTWFTGEYSGTATNATKEQQKLFNGKSYFDTPKPTKLIKRLINLAVQQDKDAIIVDFFSGSASTAHSIMELNANDDGKRKYILIQIPDNLDKRMENATANYRKKIQTTIDFLDSVGRKYTLDQIGIERIIRAAKSIKDNTEVKIDYGFKHYELCEPNENTLDKLEKFDRDAALDDQSILDTFGTATVLATWLVKDGYGFNANTKEVDLGGYIAYLCGKHLYMIKTGISNDNIKALLEKYQVDGGFNPENIVLFGYSFFGWTQIEMIKNNVRLLNDGEKNLKVNVITRY
ncbi:site-specific DNA-methyltransferase [Clostridium sp.]|uniref:site-specific DNA-methyltransferase n=1 Tax=Clostridium sp. TaxID=1506 RepID=UPI003D6C8088